MQGPPASLYHDNLASNNSVVTRFLQSPLSQQTGGGGSSIGCSAMLGMQRQQERHSKTAGGSGGGGSNSGGGVGAGGEEGGDAAAKLRTACDHCSTKKIKVRRCTHLAWSSQSLGCRARVDERSAILHVDHVAYHIVLYPGDLRWWSVQAWIDCR